MAFGVTVDGFVLKTAEDIRAEIDSSQRASIDPGLVLDDRSTLGQVNAVFTSQLAEIWQMMHAVYASGYADSASGDALDEVAALTGTTRDGETKATVTAQITKDAGVSLPAGSVANIAGQANARFLSLTEVAIGVTGPVDVEFEAETAGFLTIGPNQLTGIAEPVTGWISVDNTDGGVSGTDVELDPDLRLKRQQELTGQGSTTVDAIQADLSRDVDGVGDSLVLENETDIVDPVTGAPPHSVYALVRGGLSADIGASIFGSKAAGINTHGAELEVVTDSQGNDHNVRFDYSTELTFYAIITVTTDPNVFDGVGGGDAIKQAIADYVNGLSVGDDVIVDFVRCAVLVPGVTSITSLNISFFFPPSGSVDLPVAYNEHAAADVTNIIVGGT